MSDAIEFLSGHHRQFEQLWTRIDGQPGPDATEAAKELVRLLSQHDAIETQLLYPELRKAAAETGEQLSADSLEVHQKARELLTDVDGKELTPERLAILTQCMTAVFAHATEEEHVIFPLLRQSVDQQRLDELGEKMAGMMGMAPTHPHPTTPDSKAGATVAGTVSGVVDKLRDAVRDR